MSKIKLTPPSVGEKDANAEPLVTTALKEVEEWLNGKNIETTDNLKKEGIAEESLSKELQEKLSTRLGFISETKTVSFNAVTEKHYDLNKAGITATLPAPTLNRIVSLWANLAGKVTASSGKIYGDFITGATTIELLEFQHVIVIANGTNWEIIAGEPKREEKWGALTARTGGTEYEPSATREALVWVQGERITSEGVLRIAPVVGGVALPAFNGGNVPIGRKESLGPFMVPAGIKWKVEAAASCVFESSYLIR